MISVQYLNIRLNKEGSSAHEYDGNTVLLASFRQMHICTTDSRTEYLALWIRFTSTVAVCRPAV